MEDDEIDYNVVFPDAVTSERHWQGTKEPVVILLGWAGSKDKHLSKYSNIYNEQGCVTIGYTAPLKTVFISESFGYKELRNIAMKLLEILYDYEVENSPIFFHIFSNGGFMLYRYIVELLQSEKQFSSLCVTGALVDSAPGSGNVCGALRALTATLGQKINPVLKYIVLALFAVAVFLLRIVLYPLTKYIHKNHYDAVRDRPPAWPHLFLYSSADQVIRHTDIEAFVETIQQKGVQADHVDFVSSPHVSHFRDFPEQYALKCRNFLVGCMKNVEGTEKKRHHIDNH
ncbi:transmembrane protein 53 isoform X1 [Thalassophryne amazonica]|uniref:transmembrane protein 53 isoform X1 n=1 Tax=Thalassophryne amazonica TaxID=390379 RepID=UPI0014714A7F|nr:transmembrane protein 53 isoform X1 [Thalassophryne amazonica]